MSPGTAVHRRTTRLAFAPLLGTLLLVSLVLRVGYLLALPASDPAATGAILDGLYYVEWGRALAAGAAVQQGAYYLAPLYAWLLAGFFTIFGDQIAWLYLLQHVLVVSSALLLALCARDLAGDVAGLASAALLLLYHPALFFPSRPLGEPVAVFLLVLAIRLLSRPRASPWAWALAGVASGVSALARPNLLLVILVWFVVGLVFALRPAGATSTTDAGGRRRASLVLALAGVALVLTPVLVRNWRVSGHLVPISANAGITLYHGNGPGARGIGVLPPGFSGLLATQRQEATSLASVRAGRALDDVEADRWWGRQAVRARLADPVGTLVLQLRRAVLTISTRELDLDYAPSIDGNPWRWSAPLPFALLIALAAGGLFAAGFQRSGGWIVWGAVLACLATPLLFYVSSRYRLPAALLLTLPAGVGVAALVRSHGRSRRSTLAVVVAVAAISALVPAHQEASTAQAVALAQRGALWQRAGELALADRDLRQALAVDPACAPAHCNLGVLRMRQGGLAEAERHYRQALRLRPSFVAAAQNLSSLLLRSERAREALPILHQALAIRPDCEGCWKNLIVAHYVAGEAAAARAAVGAARRAGVTLDPDWVAGVDRSLAGAGAGQAPPLSEEDQRNR